MTVNTFFVCISELFTVIDCFSLGRTVELVQSMVQAAKYVNVTPPVETIATQTEVLQPEADVTTADKSTETLDVSPAELKKEAVSEVEEETGNEKPEEEEPIIKEEAEEEEEEEEKEEVVPRRKYLSRLFVDIQTEEKVMVEGNSFFDLVCFWQKYDFGKFHNKGFLFFNSFHFKALCGVTDRYHKSLVECVLPQDMFYSASFSSTITFIKIPACRKERQETQNHHGNQRRQEEKEGRCQGQGRTNQNQDRQKTWSKG